MTNLKAAILRLARVLVAQTISWIITTWGGVTLPVIPITIGAIINAIAKYLRDKFPTWGNWLPV
jgi:hypothetical protein